MVLSLPDSFQQKLLKLYDFAIMLKDTLKSFPTIAKNRKVLLSEMYVIGSQAFLLVMLGGLFSGIILAIEVGHSMEKFGATLLISRSVAYGMIRELGPVITGILLAARTGAKNTSEIGAMQLSEQVEALKAFGISPIEKLVVPRVIASLIMFFPLTFIADITGILGGMFIANTTFHIDLAYAWSTTIRVLNYKDIFVGAIKPIFFAFFIGCISCYYGLLTKGGTNNLGKNAINSVVISTATVLTLDFIFTKVVWEIL